MPRPATQDATRPLRDAVSRALRGKQQRWVVLALHLSRLAPPAPRPHHQRIARAVLDDAASRREGQLFTLPTGDMVLLFTAPDAGATLATTLAHLFEADAPDPDVLLSRWSLPADVTSLLAFLDALPTISGAPSGPELDAGLAAVMSLSHAIAPARIRELMERQTGILVAMTGSVRVVPLYRELHFSLPALEARAAASGHVAADPFLFRHLIAKLERSMLDAAVTDLRREGSILAWARGGQRMLHLNMTMEAIMSPMLSRLAQAAEEVDARVAVEVALVEAMADTDAFLRARERLREVGFSLVLDDVSHHAIQVMRPAALRPDFLKLEWSRQVPSAGPVLEGALQAIGPAKIILNNADTEDAVRWGIAHGIRRFQGRHVDAIIAASRLGACPESGNCNLRKCAEIERATTAVGRTGCGNLPLLDAAVPNLEHAE